MNIAETDETIIRRTFVGFVHELEELVHHRLEKLPVSLEEARVLADNIHDIRSNNGFVVLAALNLTQAK